MRYRFNLAPKDIRGGGPTDLGGLILILILAVYIAGLIGVGILYEERYINLQGSLSKLNYQKNQLIFDEQAAKQILDRISNLQTAEMKDRKILNLLNDLAGGRILWSQTLAQLTHIVPEGVWLQSMSSTGEGQSRSVVFRGRALSNQWVSRFLFLLENRPDFSDVRLEYSRLSKIGEKEVYNFEVNARMTPTAGRS